MWPEYGYLGHDTFSIQLGKENMPENSLFYLSQGRLSYKGSNNIFYCDFFILSQILEWANPPSNINNHAFNEYELMLYRPKYDVITGNFMAFIKQSEI